MDEICEICGKRKAITKVLIEGAEMMACASCANLGKKISKSPPSKPTSQSYHKMRIRKEIDIVDGYGWRIKKARQELGLSLEELAKKINEKSGYLEMVEQERTLPSLKLAKKLEAVLKISLITEVVQDVGIGKSGAKRPDLTLADVVVFEKKKG